MEILLRLYLIFIYISFIPSLIYAEDVCLKKGPCLCEFPNGTGIDLSPSAASTFFAAQSYNIENNGSQYTLSTYYYHPCYDMMLQTNTSASNNTCNQVLSICRHVNTMNLTDPSKSMYTKDIGVYDYLGKSDLSKFSANGDSIIYENGPSKTIVLLVCAQTEDRLQIYSLAEPNDIELAFYSRSACLKQIEELGRSFGSTLLIIFFSFVIFYLVLGICTKKFLMGATGIEVIPNLGFWTDLPNLVKDGWAFMVNGFKLPVRSSGPVTSPDPNSYDSI